MDWPAPKVRVYRDGMPKATGDWVGSLLQEQQDESGLLYQRNRYYDPMTGQFTKMDPIGLAGGLNLYGFAEGDPVTFSDPFGLKPDTVTPLDATSKAAIAELVKSKSFREAYEKLDADPNTTVLLYVSRNNCANDSPACALGPINMGHGKNAYVAVFDPGSVTAENALAKFYGDCSWG